MSARNPESHSDILAVYREELIKCGTIIAPYKSRKLILPPSLARDDACLYALSSYNACYLASLVSQGTDNVRHEWMQRWNQALIETMKGNWLPMRDTLQLSARTKISASRISDEGYKDFAEDIQWEGEAEARLASFLDA